MSTGLFQDEEDGYNLEEETKYKLKLDAPKGEPAFDDSSNDEDLSGLEDLGGDEKPFDDEPFDAGVEASETEDPEKYIQQLTGKLGTSIRKYNDERGQPDFDLEKFAVNSVISATHTSEMSEEDQEDIIKKVKTSGAADDDVEVDVDSNDAGDEKLDGLEDLDGNLEDKELGETLDILSESEYQGKKVELNKPSRGDVKKFKVYVKNDKGNVVKVNFGDPNMEIKRDNPERKKAFRARHNCDNPGPKWKARYWSCKMWSSTPVSKMTEELSEGEDMFIQNLKNIKNDTDKILSMDKNVLKNKLKNSDWAKDHISTSTDDTDEVSNYLTNEDKDPCWDGYQQIGMKDKNGKEVPNCVPISESPELTQNSSDTFELNELNNLNKSKKNNIFTENMDIMDYIKNKVHELMGSETEPVIKPTITPTETPSPRRKRIWEPKPLVSPKPKASK